ncbi:MAG: MarR family transcriptional regulator [Bauldia sp.]
MKRRKKQAASPGSPARAALVNALNRAARQASGLGVIFGQAVAARLGVNGTDLECLDIIALGGEVTAGDIAKATGLTTGAITGVIDRLERAGLARRERVAADRRKVYVRLTPAARTRGAALYGSFAEAVDRLVNDYSDTEIGLLIDYFTRSRAAILSETEKLTAMPPRRHLRLPRRAAAAAARPPRPPPRR